MEPNPHITVLGAGPVGSLWATFLGRAGYEVEVYDRRPDMRHGAGQEGRSINLAISTRGLHALKQVGLEKKILGRCIPMRGRMMHAVNGKLTFQPYGKDDSQCIYSLSRAELNKTLVTAAETTGKVEFKFQYRAMGADLRAGTLTIKQDDGDRVSVIKPNVIFAADGAGSVVRESMKRLHEFHGSETLLNYGYKELHLPAGNGGSFQLEKNALHIWPRGTYMLIALPNLDGSFTCTLFLPMEGQPSFARLKTPSEITAFFEGHFPDALALMPDLVKEFLTNPTGRMVTVKCTPWFVEDKFLLLGDAAHAIVPFFGQGMNCGFEDCTWLDNLMKKVRPSTAGNPQWAPLFKAFHSQRKPDADAIADLALENFVEMRDKVADPRFLLEREVEVILQRKFPETYLSRYSLVTFTRVNYRYALQAGSIENGILSELCRHITRADEVDLDKAQKLISTRLAPLIKEARAEVV